MSVLVPLTAPAVVEPSLAVRLRDRVLTFANAQTLVCPFEPGGQLHGVGIPSSLYCRLCCHARLWHDVAQAAAIVAAHESALKEQQT